MSLFKGVGLFFNMTEDRDRIAGLANSGKVQWIAPIMAPDQSSVQHNRKNWSAWREAMPNTPFLCWIVCDDPVEDYERTTWVVQNYKCDGILINAEKSYEGAGFWKAKVLCDLLADDIHTAVLPKLLSPPSSAAEIYNMDWRTFEKHGFWTAPQAYWNEFPDATVKNLFQSMYLPKQLKVGWDYRIQVFTPPGSIKRWGRIVSWDGGNVAILRDLGANKLYRVPVRPQEDSTGFKYCTVLPDRKMYSYKSTGVATGRILGFQVPEKIVPTAGVYAVNGTLINPGEVKTQFDAVPNLVGGSIYLGETSTSAHVEKLWESINS